MKITRKQLRRIVETITAYGGSSTGDYQPDKEAVYAIIYTAEYVRVYAEILYLSIFKMLKQAGESRTDTKFKTINALEDLESVFKDIILSWEGPKYDMIVEDAKSDGIEAEAEAAAKLDFQESVYTGIQKVERLINQQTPIGMSAIDALKKLGHSKRGFIAVINRTVPFLLSLMDDDTTLAIFDELDSHPTLRQISW